MQSSAEWSFYPRLRVAGGHESDLLLDANLDQPVVEAGGFLQLGPSLSLQRRSSTGQLLRLYSGARFERYLNDHERLRSSGWLWAEWLHRSGAWQTRLAGGGRFFDDSERSTVRQFGGNAELGLGYVRRRWSLELSGGPRGRRYPDYQFSEVVMTGRGTNARADTVLVTYSEKAWTAALEGAVLPHPRILLRGELRHARTDARDDRFDSRSWSITGRGEWRLWPRIRLILAGGWQRRQFEERSAEEDDDSYAHASAGTRLELSERIELDLRYAYGRYLRPTGEEEDTRRLELGLTVALGRAGESAGTRSAAEDLRRILREADASRPERPPGLFRLHAPDAAAVSVAGDFNGWNPQANPLKPVGDGWWEIRLELSPGIHQYAYVVDGAWITPPEADRTLDDGFGGRNGILEIPPAQP